ncbi:MAG TPA: sigma-70 family RNA polymerase sigma factor [Armatimonadaceae bacterium]|nr:sigma-70 family RNA polymerase sigma factor [Armatimonadaceae bacterium]
MTADTAESGGGCEALESADDEALVLAALVGSLEAYDELVRRYRAAVLLTTGRVFPHDRAAAEDAAQEAFLLAFKALPKLETPAAFPGWLRAIARNRALRLAERDARAGVPAPPSDIDAFLLRESREVGRRTMGEDPGRVWERRDERECLLRAIESLPDEQREALWLRAVEEWPIARIAAYLRVNETAVRGRLYRARESLRRLLLSTAEDDDNEIDHTKQKRRKPRGK